MSVVGFIVHEGRPAAVDAAATLGAALHGDGRDGRPGARRARTAPPPT